MILPINGVLFKLGFYFVVSLKIELVSQITDISVFMKLRNM